MLKWFRKLTLEEKMQKVKDKAKKDKLTSDKAYITYFLIALNYNYEDAAKEFFHLHMQEAIHITVGNCN